MLVRGPAIGGEPDVRTSPGDAPMPLNSRGREDGRELITKVQVQATVEAAVKTIQTSCVTPADVPQLARYMKQKGIADVERGVKEFLQAKAGGTAADDPNVFTVDDLETVQRYAKRNNINLNKDGIYRDTVERYKADKREGKIERYRT